MFKSALLLVRGTVSQANAVLSVDKISTVLSGMVTLVGKFVGEYRRERRRGKENSVFLLVPRTFFLWIFVFCGASLPWTEVHKTPEESMRHPAHASTSNPKNTTNLLASYCQGPVESLRQQNQVRC